LLKDYEVAINITQALVTEDHTILSIPVKFFNKNVFHRLIKFSVIHISVLNVRSEYFNQYLNLSVFI